MPLFRPSTATATVGVNTNVIAIAGMDLTAVTEGMTISLGSRGRKMGEEYIIQAVAPNGSTGGSITVYDAVQANYANAPFVIDAVGFAGDAGTFALLAAVANQNLLNAFLGGTINLSTGSRQLKFDKLASSAVSQALFVTGGRSWADLSHRALTYTPTGGAAVTDEVLALRAFPDGTTPVDAIAIHLPTGGADVRMASVSVAAATTTDLGSAPFGKWALTGAGTITSFGAGKHLVRYVHVVDGGVTLAHNATSLILPGKANIACAAGDTFFLTSDGSGNWRVRDYQRADGTPLIASPSLGDSVVINGGFTVNQPKVGFLNGYTSGSALAAGAKAHDRWKAGSAGLAYTFSPGAVDTTVTITAGTLVQVIDAQLVAWSSWWLTWMGTASARVWQGSASGGYAAGTKMTVGGVEVNALLVTTTVGAPASIEFSGGSVGRVRFAPGSATTRPDSYQRRLNEPALCRRYYYVAPALSGGWSAQTTTMTVAVTFTQTMRAIPGIILLNGSVNGGSALEPYVSQHPVTAIAGGLLTEEGGRVDLTTQAALGQYRPGILEGGTIAFDAEI